jgi:hypothetical protein
MPQAQGELVNLLQGKPDVFRALQFGLPVVRSVVSPTWTAVATITTSEQTMTVPGVDVGDFVAVVKPTHQTGLGVVNARVSAKNTVAVTFMNPTAGSLTPTAAEVYLVLHARLIATA